MFPFNYRTSLYKFTPSYIWTLFNNYSIFVLLLFNILKKQNKSKQNKTENTGGPGREAAREDTLVCRRRGWPSQGMAAGDRSAVLSLLSVEGGGRRDGWTALPFWTTQVFPVVQ